MDAKNNFNFAELNTKTECRKTDQKPLKQLRAEKERVETRLAQEQHKLERLENRKKYLEQGVQAAISTETEKITQPSGAATPSGAPTTKPQKRQSWPF